VPRNPLTPPRAASPTHTAQVRFTDVTDTWYKRVSGPIRVNYYDSALVRTLLNKTVWVAWRFYLPLAVLNIPHAVFWPLFAISELASGYWLAWNFEVSHLAPHADFPRTEAVAASDAPFAVAAAVGLAEAAKAAGKKAPAGSATAAAAVAAAAGAPAPAAPGAPAQLIIPRSWAVVQAESSVDYGHGSAWVAFWCGALNYQIEHHLFPGISQYLYPGIAPIVKKTCE
jgi:fatty acid desaturase